MRNRTIRLRIARKRANCTRAVESGVLQENHTRARSRAGKLIEEIYRDTLPLSCLL